MHAQNCCFLVIKPIVFVAFPLPSPSSDLKVPSTELLKQQLRRRLQKRHLNWGKVALLQTWSRLFHLVQFVKFWQFFLELNLKRLHRSSGKGKGKENRCLAAFLFLSRLKLGMSCSDGQFCYGQHFSALRVNCAHVFFLLSIHFFLFYLFRLYAFFSWEVFSRGYSWEFLVGCAARFSLFQTKNVIFLTRFLTRPLKSIPVFRSNL